MAEGIAITGRGQKIHSLMQEQLLNSVDKAIASLSSPDSSHRASG